MQLSTSFDSVRHLVSAWIRRQNNAGVSRPSVPPDNRNPESADEWFKNLRYTGFPQTVPEKLDTLLKVYTDMVRDNIGMGIKPHLYPHLVAEIAAKNSDEVKTLTQLLHQSNYVDFSDGTAVKIKVEGWRRIDEISKRVNLGDSAFVAMWFHQCTQEYRSATVKALEYCGYKPLIVDETEFNGFIMNQIVALIRQSRFLVADFTCRPEDKKDGAIIQGVRGGVYWEAGMAYGMAKPSALARR